MYVEVCIVKCSDKSSKEVSGATSFACWQADWWKIRERGMYMYQEIAVTSFYFAKGNIQKSFPRRIETEQGQQISFIESGLRCVVQRGQELVQIFNMTDGQKLYRLGFEPNNNTWKLLSTRTMTEN